MIEAFTVLLRGLFEAIEERRRSGVFGFDGV